MRSEVVILIKPLINAPLLILHRSHQIALLNKLPLQCSNHSLHKRFVFGTVGMREVLRDFFIVQLGMKTLEIL